MTSSGQQRQRAWPLTWNPNYSHVRKSRRVITSWRQFLSACVVPLLQKEGKKHRESMANPHIQGFRRRRLLPLFFFFSFSLSLSLTSSFSPPPSIITIAAKASPLPKIAQASTVKIYLARARPSSSCSFLYTNDAVYFGLLLLLLLK